MSDRIHDAIREACALLVTLRRDKVAPEAAWRAFQPLRQRHAGIWMNLVWEEETYGADPHYDILLGADQGTFSLSYCADEQVPWAVRGLQRVNESLVVRVNDRPLRISQAMSCLDYVWGELHIGRHLINVSLVEQELLQIGLEASADEMGEAMLRFRQKRGLFTVEQVERWLVEHGTSEAMLENHVRDEVLRDKLRRRVTAGQEAAYFERHRKEFDRVRAARFHVADAALAERLHEKLRREPQQFLAMAQANFLERGLEQGADGDLWMTVRRGELEPEQAESIFATPAGQVAPPVPSGEGYDLVLVLQHVPAELDAATRETIIGLLFDEWLAEKRRTARIEWFWGASEPLALPALTN
ncbi:MAG TPA: TIGR04500 family putative peptide maturation system protein [Polyangia bacterium]|jgi:putative peptide maturation system protein|nr:TIGR04500 family putative peptide maturation system protein [Polyangia bacterium]